MTNYTPKPGSFPGRLLAHLSAVGGTMTKLEMAQAFGEPRKNLDGLLKTAMAHGVFADCGMREDGQRAFGLPGADPLQVAPAPSAALTLGSSSALVTGRTDKAKKKAAEAAPRKVKAAAPVEEPPAAEPPIAALFSDGDFVLYGLQINTDDSATMSEGQARRVHAFLVRVFGPNV